MLFIHDISRVMATIAGTNGISEPVFKRALQRSGEALATLKAEPLPVFERCCAVDDIDAIEATAQAIRQRFSTVVVCGMGGSSLSGKMLSALTHNPFTNLCGKVRLLFLENIDPVSMDLLTGSLDYSTTLFLIISKSGGTAETMAHISILWEAAEAKLGRGNAGEHFLALTEQRDNPLRRFCASHKVRVLEHAADIGGRYAALTVVGLLPASIAGLDIHAIRAGAAHVIQTAFEQGEASPAAQGAAVAYTLAEQGKNISVLMPYCDKLGPFTLWHRQIWAESLGKNGKGITPAPAIGSVDQHSQLQLYLDGPRDKYFTLMVLNQRGNGAAIPSVADDSMAYLEQHTIGDLMDAHQYGTLETLTRKQCPTRLITLPALNEAVLGGLTAHFMLETILTARVMGIDPLDQPAVEDGKKLAIQHLTGIA